LRPFGILRLFGRVGAVAYAAGVWGFAGLEALRGGETIAGGCVKRRHDRASHHAVGAIYQRVAKIIDMVGICYAGGGYHTAAANGGSLFCAFFASSCSILSASMEFSSADTLSRFDAASCSMYAYTSASTDEFMRDLGCSALFPMVLLRLPVIHANQLCAYRATFGHVVQHVLCLESGKLFFQFCIAPLCHVMPRYAHRKDCKGMAKKQTMHSRPFHFDAHPLVKQWAEQSAKAARVTLAEFCRRVFNEAYDRRNAK
jgi:hypothetical protein